jgi:2',3'-cyclic-nucleotide 2'-phosphodiesterase (5'-nucleotidase family)
MGYDLQAPGNAISITYGPQAVAAMTARASYPMLAGNFVRPEGALVPGIEALRVYPLNDRVRLGVLGMTTNAPDIYELFGLNAQDFLVSARYWLDQLAQQGARPRVVVTHLGITDDRVLAEAFPEIDVIIGGHSHTHLPEGEQVNGVLIAQTGEYAEFLGRVDLTVDAVTGKVLEKTARLLPVPTDIPHDPAVDAAIQAAEEDAAEFLSMPVGALQCALTMDHFGESGMGDLAADAIRERMNAEIGLLSSGLFVTGLPAGTVTLGALDAACFTTANPQLSAVRGEQILAGLEHGLDPVLMNTVIKMFRGTPIGMPIISGMEVTYAPDAPEGERVRSARVQGAPLERERIYRVAHTDAETHPIVGYLNIEEAQVLKVEVPTILREAIADYMQAHAPVPPPTNGRWKIAI